MQVLQYLIFLDCLFDGEQLNGRPTIKITWSSIYQINYACQRKGCKCIVGHPLLELDLHLMTQLALFSLFFLCI